jgi:hypothetical protein
VWSCSGCHRTIVLDDVAVVGDAATCHCLRCRTLQTGAALPVPRALRAAVTATLAESGWPIPVAAAGSLPSVVQPDGSIILRLPPSPARRPRWVRMLLRRLLPR